MITAELKFSCNLNCWIIGIGVATASAVLCCLSPGSVPFMADEVIEVATAGCRNKLILAYIHRNSYIDRLIYHR